MTDSCATCRFFRVAGHRPRVPSLAAGLTPTSTPATAPSGECHFLPPRNAVGSERVTEGYARIVKAEWPILPASEWCGQFQASEP